MSNKIDKPPASITERCATSCGVASCRAQVNWGSGATLACRCDFKRRGAAVHPCTAARRPHDSVVDLLRRLQQDASFRTEPHEAREHVGVLLRSCLRSQRAPFEQSDASAGTAQHTTDHDLQP